MKIMYEPFVSFYCIEKIWKNANFSSSLFLSLRFQKTRLFFSQRETRMDSQSVTITWYRLDSKTPLV